MATSAAANSGLAPGLLVRIAIPGRERVTASVTHVTATWIGLRLVGLGGPRPRDLHGERAAVEYVADDGIHRLRGDLEEAEGMVGCALRFVLSSGEQFLGRRQHLRTALSAPVVLTVERTREKFSGRSINVSEGGMMVGDLSGVLPGPGTMVKFALAPRNARDPIFGTGVVLRANAVRGTLALDFDQVSRSAADEIARLVFENEQGMRARRR
jgi:hypothetical protein